MDVKVGELPAWLSRRSKNPMDWGRAVARGWWRWHFNWTKPRKAGMAAFFQFAAGYCTLFYLMNYKRTYGHHKNFRYHW